MEMRQLQTDREVRQELNLQDQVERLSQGPRATEKETFFRFISISKVSARTHVQMFPLSSCQVELEMESVKKQQAANADSSSLATNEEVSILR